MEPFNLEDYLPQPKSLPGPPIIGAGGIQAHSMEDGETMLSAKSQPAEESDTGATAATDPTANAAFRVSYADGIITIKRGFLDYVKWESGTWMFPELEIAQGTLNLATLGLSLPLYVFLKVPVTNHRAESSSTSPYDTFVSDEQEIEGAGYTFRVEYTTDWIGPDATRLDTWTFFEARAAFHPTASATEYRRILAFITASGVVQQSNFANVTLPQAFTARIVDYNV